MTVLNTYTESYITILTLLCFLVAVVFGFSCYFYYNKHGLYSLKHKIITIVLGIVALAGLICIPVLSLKTEEYTECVLSDTYPVLELYENYEIYDRRGDIWVLSNLKKEESK
jgi:hypothetical protein